MKINLLRFVSSKRQRKLQTLFHFLREKITGIFNPPLPLKTEKAQNAKKMKKFIVTAAMAAMVLMPVSAQARRENNSSDRRGNYRMERREQVNNKKAPRHMPARGTRFDHRPMGGKMMYKGGDKYLIVDGVIYKETRLYSGRIVYIVVG